MDLGYTFPRTSTSTKIRKKKMTRRDVFLLTMEAHIPWEQIRAIVEPHYPSGKRGRPPISLDRMLRMYFLKCWYNMAYEGLEDTICESVAMQNFIGVNLARESVPDATTLLKFNRLLQSNNLTARIMLAVDSQLKSAGLVIRPGDISEATTGPATNAFAEVGVHLARSRYQNDALWNFTFASVRGLK